MTAIAAGIGFGAGFVLGVVCTVLVICWFSWRYEKWDA